MADFKKAYEMLIENEGGYANNPNDKGGETYKGIARKYWPDWSGWITVDEYKSKQNFPISLEVNAELQKMVENFYKENFWDKVYGDSILENEIAFSIFDFAVNAGISTSVKLMQKAIGTADDGIIGKQTLSLINSVDKELFNAKFAIEKIKKYVRIVENDKSQGVFLLGWVKRTVKDF